jgi:hypothetical protein
VLTVYGAGVVSAAPLAGTVHASVSSEDDS